MHELFVWVLHYTGSDNVSGPWYGFYSGFGSDLGEYTVAAAVVTGVVHSIRKHNCQTHGCWRIGRLSHDHDGRTLMLCHRHHPVGQPSHTEILAAYAKEAA